MCLLRFGPGALDPSMCSVQFSYLPLSGPAEEHSSPRRRQERPGQKDREDCGSDLWRPGVCVAVTFGGQVCVCGGMLEGRGALMEDEVYDTPSASPISLCYAKTPRSCFTI